VEDEFVTYVIVHHSVAAAAAAAIDKTTVSEFCFVLHGLIDRSVVNPVPSLLF